MDPFWAGLDKSIVTFFNPLAADPAVRAPVRNDWPLHRLDHAFYTATAYVIFVLSCRFLLEDRNAPKPAPGERKAKPSVAEKIKSEGVLVFGAMALYNMTQVVLCGWIVYASIAEHRRRNLSLVCNPHVLEEDGMAFVLHVFYLSKVLDFVDTLFMIVKRSWRQMSFLHVYHHYSVFLVYWLNANANYDADIYLTMVLNGTIHFIMYGYYFATAFNVQVPGFLKKLLTNAQLVQFVCMESQGAYLLLYNCSSPWKITVLYMVYISTMLILFLDFKRKTYNNRSKSSTGAAKESKAGGKKNPDESGFESDTGGRRLFFCC